MFVKVAAFNEWVGSKKFCSNQKFNLMHAFLLDRQKW